MFALVKTHGTVSFERYPVYLDILDFNHRAGIEIQSRREVIASKEEAKERATNEARPDRHAACSLPVIFQ